MSENFSPELLLDNIDKSIVYADRDHVIRYMNAAGKQHYEKYGDLVGKGLFDCHNEASKTAILGYVARLEAGEDEVLYDETPERRLYIRSVRSPDGYLVGYYEIIEPPRGS